MAISDNSTAFAARIEEACAERGMPLRGRQSAIARALHVTQQAVRKWRSGEAYPDMARAIALANWLGVNVLWLLQGSGPKRGERIDPHVLALVEAIEHLPKEERGHIANYLGFEFQKLPNWFVAEAQARYMAALDALAAKPANPPANAGNQEAA